MLRIVPFLLMAILTTACLPTARLEQGPGIVGTYVVNGIDPVGTEYTGRVSIAAGSDPGTYVIEWVVTGALLQGVGTLDGTALTVEWGTVNAPRGTSTGSAEYEVMDDGTLIGTRTVDGFDRAGTETIYPDP